MSSKSIVATLVLLGTAIAAPRFVSAGTITFGIANETAPINGVTGGTGSFDIVVYENGGGDKLYQYQFDLFVQQGASNVHFDGKAYNQPGPAPSGVSNIEDTVAPYVFAGDSSISGNSDVLVFPTQTGNEVVNSDSVGADSNAPALTSTLLAMAHVVFTVPAGTAAGSYVLTFNQDNLQTDPFADYINNISTGSTAEISPGAAINGAIQVVTPEPGSMVLLLLGAAGLLLAVRCRR